MNDDDRPEQALREAVEAGEAGFIDMRDVEVATRLALDEIDRLRAALRDPDPTDA